MRLLLSFLMLIALAACSTTQLPLPYSPQSAGMPTHGPALAASVSAVDRRDESARNPKLVGAIRGGFGKRLKQLETDRPVAEVVADAVREALRARGMLGAVDAPYKLRVTIETLNSSQYVRREAKALLRLAWVRQTDGQPAFTNQGEANVVNGGMSLEVGIFGSVEELRAVTAEAMSKAIDQALDDPALTAFLSASR